VVVVEVLPSEVVASDLSCFLLTSGWKIDDSSLFRCHRVMNILPSCVCAMECVMLSFGRDFNIKARLLQ